MEQRVQSPPFFRDKSTGKYANEAYGLYTVDLVLSVDISLIFHTLRSEFILKVV